MGTLRIKLALPARTPFCIHAKSISQNPEEDSTLCVAEAERKHSNSHLRVRSAVSSPLDDGRIVRKLDPATGLVACMLRFTRATRLSATLEFRIGRPPGFRPPQQLFCKQRGSLAPSRTNPRLQGRLVSEFDKSILQDAPTTRAKKNWGDQWDLHPFRGVHSAGCSLVTTWSPG